MKLGLEKHVSIKNNKKLRAILIYNVVGNNNKIMEEKKELTLKQLKQSRKRK